MVSAPPTLTHCPYCSLQCGIGVVAGDRPATLQPIEFPTNRGGLCSKGWTAATLLDHPQRLLTPLLRTVPGDRASTFRPASWDEAFAVIVTGIEQAQQAYGRDAVGCFGGGGLTNEKAYALGKFARVALRTAMIDYNGRFCMSSAATAANRAFGVDRGLPFPLADIADAEAILLVGSNPAATMPPAMQWFDAGRERGATHIIVDPRVRRRPTAHRSIWPRCPGRTWPWPTGCCTWPSGTVWSTRTTYASGPAVSPACAPGSAPTGRTGWSGSPVSVSPLCGRPCTPWPRRSPR